MNRFEKFLESKGITMEKYQAMDVAEIAKLHSEYQDTIHKELQKAIQDAGLDATKLTAVEKQITDFIAEMKGIDKDAWTKVNDQIKNQGLEITKLKEQGMSKDDQLSVKASLKAQFEKIGADKLSEMKDNPDAKLQLTIKVAVAMTFATNTTGNVGRVERMSGIVDILRRTPVIMDIVNTSTTNASVFEWVEKSGHEGGVEMVAEGAIKPIGDWDLQLFAQKPKKMALIVTTSKEMLDDIDGLSQDIVDEINSQLREFEETAILLGDGNLLNISGLDANAVPFVAGTAFADQVKAANNMDCIRVAINQVALAFDNATHVLMHPSDATIMELEKDDTTSQYILPPFTSADGTRVKGLPVITSVVVNQGEAYVGNMSRFKVKTRENITLDMGYRGQAGDWEKNMISFLGEQRLFAFIPANHYASIVKIDFTVAKALLDPAI